MKALIERIGPWCALVACVAMAHACAKSVPPGDEGRSVEVAAEAARASAPPATFDRTVGAVIAGDAALRWVDRHVARHPEGLRSVYFGRDAFAAVLGRPGAEGVSIQLALNDAGDATFVLVPLNRAGLRLPDDPSLAALTNDDGFFAVDHGSGCTSTTCPDDESTVASLHRGVGAPIPGSAARRWARAYQRLHPGGLRSVFFGRDVLERLLAQPGGEGVSIRRAIDDAGSEVLVLFPLDVEGRLLPGEGAASTGLGGEAPFAVDASNPCPPCSSDE